MKIDIRTTDDNYFDEIGEMRRILKAAKNDVKNGVITKEFVNKYIDKILVTPEGEDKLKLEIKVFTGKTCERELDNIRRRTGHTNNNICPVRTAEFNRVYRWIDGHSKIIKYEYTICF